MIYKDKTFIFIIFQIIVSNFKYFNNSKKLDIMNFLVCFLIIILLKKIL